jgi:hypothetical protein
MSSFRSRRAGWFKGETQVNQYTNRSRKGEVRRGAFQRRASQEQLFTRHSDQSKDRQANQLHDPDWSRTASRITAMSGIGPKQAFRDCGLESAFGGKADIAI